jgi:hypothetical protein
MVYNPTPKERKEGKKEKQKWGEFCVFLVQIRLIMLISRKLFLNEKSPV